MVEDLTQRLQRCYTGVVNDILRGMGLKDFVLPPELRPLLPLQPMAGPAFTVEGRVDRNADPHQTLLGWTGLLSQARSKAGHVWVCQANTDEVALMGELSGETLQRFGLHGCIIDGLVRDSRFLIDIGFQTWSRGFTPRDIVGHWLPKATDIEVRIGGVWIAPGDYMLGDMDGCLRVPRSIVGEVVGKAEAAMGAESLVRKAIREGMDPQQAYLAHRKF